MAVVQISWKDNANNETEFKIYKGTASPLSSSSTQIASVTLSGNSWVAAEFSTGSAPSLALTSSNTADSTTTNETFIITYDESNANTYFYGVAASNSVGDSDVVTSSSLVVS